MGSAYEGGLQASEFILCTAHHEPSLLRMLPDINPRVGSAYEGGLQASEFVLCTAHPTEILHHCD